MKTNAPNKLHNAPPDAQAFFDGSFYKMGLHNRPYRYDGLEWVRTNKPAHEIITYIESQRHKFNRLR